MSEGTRDPDILIGALIGPLVSLDTHCVRNNKLKSLAPNNSWIGGNWKASGVDHLSNFVNFWHTRRSKHMYVRSLPLCSLCDTRHWVHPFFEDWRCDQLRALTSWSGLRSEGEADTFSQSRAGNPRGLTNEGTVFCDRGQITRAWCQQSSSSRIIIRLEQETALHRQLLSKMCLVSKPRK